MQILDSVKLDYSDVLILPKLSDLVSRKDVNLNVNYNFKYSSYKYSGIPIVFSNMVGVGSLRIAKAVEKHNMLVFLTREERSKWISDIKLHKLKNIVPTFGTTEDELEILKLVIKNINPRHIGIDVANAGRMCFIDYIKMVRDDLKYTGIITAGNTATPEISEKLVLAGASLVKCGIGQGNQCRTRIQAGIGVPQLSAIIECADAVKHVGALLMADGGVVCPGDVAKSFSAGAAFSMIGSYFAGHDEGDQEIIEVDGKKYIEFYGNSSFTAQKKSGDIKDHRTSEGRTTLIPYKGPIEETIKEILGSLRSTCSYVGSRNLKELHKRTTFIRVNSQLNKNYEKYTIGN